MIVITSDRLFGRNAGGNSTYARKICGGLSSLGITHRVLSPAIGSLVLDRGALRTTTYAPWEGLRLPNLAKKQGGDLLFFPGDTGPLARSAIPMAVTVHGVASRHVAGVRGKAHEVIWRARVRKAIQHANAVITVSESSARDVSEEFGVPRSAITVIPHGIDHERFSPREPQPTLLARYGISEPYALYLGNLDPRKNVDALIDAFETSDIDLPLVVAGKPAWDASNTLHRLAGCANVRYLGPVPDEDVPNLMSAATVFVFPSLYEGFGFPVLEAMSCGTAVICSDRGSLADVAGDSAFILEDLSGEGIRAGVNRVVRDGDLRRALQIRGLNRASTFKWSDSIERHANLFSSLVEAAQ